MPQPWYSQQITRQRKLLSGPHQSTVISICRVHLCIRASILFYGWGSSRCLSSTAGRSAVGWGRPWPI